MKTFLVNGYIYHEDDFGAIHQLYPESFVYDHNYCSTYDTEEYRRNSDILQALRIGTIMGAYGEPPMSIIDFGYGNGAFMKYAKQSIPNVYGYDVTGIEVEGCTILEKLTGANVITFWDSLEHIQDLSFLENLECEMIAISLPWCHAEYLENVEEKIKCLENWKHLKPNEHLHHFSAAALVRTLMGFGWEVKTLTAIEDIVRKPVDNKENILTATFKRC